MAIPAHKVVGNEEKPGQLVYPEPPTHWRPPRYLRDEIARIQDQERMIQKEEPIERPRTRKEELELLGYLADIDKRLVRLKTALLSYLNREEEYIRDSDGVYRGLMVPSEDIREILEQSEKST